MSRVIGGKKRVATFGQKVCKAARSHLWGAFPADLHGSTRRASVQAKGFGAITREKVTEVNGSGFLGSTFDTEEKMLSFDVKTPICRGERQT